MFSHITGLRPTAHFVALLSIVCFLVSDLSAQELNAPYQSQLPAPLPGSGFASPDQAPYGPANQSQLPILAQATPAQTAPAAVAGAPAASLQEASATLPPESNEIIHHVRSANDRMELMVNTSRIVTLDQNIPRAQVNNKDIVELTALSPTEIQVFAKKAGVTQINLWTEKGQIYTIDCVILGDARELQELLRTQYPAANLQVRPMGSGVLLSGFVDRPDQVSQIIQIAQDYYPKVIPDIRVGGVQQILLHVKVAEVDRTKARDLGFDFANINSNGFVASSISGLLSPGSVAANLLASPTANGDTVRFGVVNGNNAFFGFLNALRKDDLLKIVADPTLVTVSGRPARFHAGGQIPYPSNASLGSVSVSYKNTGITVDFVPIVLGNGNIRLEVRPEDTEIDETLTVPIAPGFSAPAFTQRVVDTGVEMQPGQTLAIAGLISKHVLAERKEIPWLGELPYIGAAFRQTSETQDEVELLFLVTPEVVAPLDPCEVPPCAPGMHTDSPTDCELFLKGYIEVPSHGPCGPNGCAPVGPSAGFGPAPNFDGPMPSYEQIPPGGQPMGSPTLAQPPAGKSSSTNSAPNYGTPNRGAGPAGVNSTYVPRSASNVNNQYNPSQPQGSRSASSANRAAAPPGIVGPTGYDVLN